MIKNIDWYKPTSLPKNIILVKMKPFSTVKAIDMYDYSKLTKRDLKPNASVFDIRTSDLSLDESPKEISKDIIKLADSMKK